MPKLINNGSSLKLVVGAVQGLPGPPGESFQPAYATVSEVVSDTEVYRAEAAPGSSETDPVWRIRKITISYGSIVTTRVKWANGSEEFVCSWANRHTYNYL